MSIGTTRSPIVRREKRTLYARVSSPFGEREESREVEVYWIRESEATTRFLHGGELVDTFSTYNDFYGPGTCMNEAAYRGESAAGRFSVTAESSAIVEVLVTISDRPILNPRPGKYKRMELDELPERCYTKDEAGERVQLEPIPVASVVVWSTKPMDVEAARAHVMSFFEPARFGEGAA